MKLPLEKLICLRQDLHQHPELSGEEKFTAERIKSFMLPWQPSTILENIGGNGIAFIYNYGQEGPTILFRCELDALPIQEDSHMLAYASRNGGVSHKCGHDGHMAIVAGLAPFLHKANYTKGRVILLFQSAEETGEGARAILKDPGFSILNPDYVFALHNLPGFEKGCVIYREGIFTAAVQSLIIYLDGVATHAAEPEKGNNPSQAVSGILHISDNLSNNKPDRDDFTLITPVYVILGQKAYGMSAGTAEVHFTMRAWTSQNLKRLSDHLISHIDQICNKNQLRYRYELIQQFASSKNDPECIALIKTAAQQLQLPSVNLSTPFKWGEDFGLFTQNYKGAIFGLGAGLQALPLHHKDYDFPDDLIVNGVNVFIRLTDLLLNL